MVFKKILLLLNDFYPFFYEKRVVIEEKENLELFPRNCDIIYLKLTTLMKNWPKDFDNSLKLLVFYYILLKDIKESFYANFLNIENFTFSKLKKKNLEFFINQIGSKELFKLIEEILEIKEKELLEKMEKLLKEKEQEIEKVKEDLMYIMLSFEHNDFPLKKYIDKKEKEILDNIYWSLYNKGVLEELEIENNSLEEYDLKKLKNSLEKILSFYLIILLRPFMELSEEQILNFFNYLISKEIEIEKSSLIWLNLIQNLSFLIIANNKIKYLEKIENNEKEFEYKILTKKFKEKKEETLVLLKQIIKNFEK